MDGRCGCPQGECDQVQKIQHSPRPAQAWGTPVKQNHPRLKAFLKDRVDGDIC